jgi:hypothetical protein
MRFDEKEELGRDLLPAGAETTGVSRLRLAGPFSTGARVAARSRGWGLLFWPYFNSWFSRFASLTPASDTRSDAAVFAFF